MCQQQTQGGTHRPHMIDILSSCNVSTTLRALTSQIPNTQGGGPRGRGTLHIPQALRRRRRECEREREGVGQNVTRFDLTSGMRDRDCGPRTAAHVCQCSGRRGVCKSSDVLCFMALCTIRLAKVTYCGSLQVSELIKCSLGLPDKSRHTSFCAA